MILKCKCCGVEEEFENPEQAFVAGWDAPPHFGYVGCPLCPGVCIALGVTHEKAHALWAKEGRPTEFSPVTCAADSDWEKYHKAH